MAKFLNLFFMLAIVLAISISVFAQLNCKSTVECHRFDLTTGRCHGHPIGREVPDEPDCTGK